jgi:hypothetical protein
LCDVVKHFFGKNREDAKDAKRRKERLPQKKYFEEQVEPETLVEYKQSLKKTSLFFLRVLRAFAVR